MKNFTFFEKFRCRGTNRVIARGHMESPCHVSTPTVVHDTWVRWKHERSKVVGGGVRMRHVRG